MDYRIKNYYDKLNAKKKFSDNETSIRSAFQNLLESYADEHKYEFVPELKGMNNTRPDGTVKTYLNGDFGHWEAKDLKDDLEEEIRKKTNRGYSLKNVIFENSKEAILYQDEKVVLKADITNPKELDRVIHSFFSYQTDDIKSFNEATTDFTNVLPLIIKDLRNLIDKASIENQAYIKKRNEFLVIAQKVINPEVSADDIREILIQHILTIEIFNSVFDENYFTSDNSIAKEVETIISTFFTGAVRNNHLNRIQNYYKIVKSHAVRIDDHRTKKKFLISMYEQFYKVYNPEEADKNGIVYTPLEIVDFMIESVDILLKRHFNVNIESKNVSILDPATGTGTFVSELLTYIYNKFKKVYNPDYITENKLLENKYDNELFCNEISILPFYIATLDIEHTYQRLIGEYREFNNIVYADTLDNVLFWERKNNNSPLFQITEENFNRLKIQNDKHIHVVMGNPPYNANQENANQNNKNRKYTHIDEMVKKTYKKHSTATKEKLDDPFIRFFRWATDRLDEDKGGIVAYITNDSYIFKTSFDGFRKSVTDEFNYIYILELGGDIYRNTKLSGSKHNVFQIKTGVAIIFLVKVPKSKDSKISISNEIDEYATRFEKYDFLKSHTFDDLQFKEYKLKKNEIDGSHEWAEKGKRQSDFTKLLNIYADDNSGIFSFRSPGVSTNRDGWVFDLDKHNLEKKLTYFILTYNKSLGKYTENNVETSVSSIKWSRDLKTRHYIKGNKLEKFDPKKVISFLYRPFFETKYYSDKSLSDVLTNNHYKIFGSNLTDNNLVICHSGPSSTRAFQAIMVNKLFGLDIVEKTQSIPLYLYDSVGNKAININQKTISEVEKQISKNIDPEAIFYYTYAILNSPKFTEKYSNELLKGYPRIIIKDGFLELAEFGKELGDIHINFQKQKEYNLKVEVIKNLQEPKKILNYISSKNIVELDENTIISGFPEDVTQYRLGLRSPIEWILDRYSPPSKPKFEYEKVLITDFNSYSYFKYKDDIISLIKKMTTLTMETIRIRKKIDEVLFK